MATDTKPRPPAQRDDYRAFHAVDRQQFRLRVRPVSLAWERLTYNYLLRIVEDNGYGTEIALVYTFCVVVIKGRNLQPIAEAIDAESCEFIQQYDPDTWQKPSDAQAPIIDNIKIHSDPGFQVSEKKK
jgi:hypothetical protein